MSTVIILFLKFTRWHKTSFFSCVRAEIGMEVRVEKCIMPRWLPRLLVYETKNRLQCIAELN